MTVSLYEATRDLHHEAEKHPFGGRMASGTLSVQEWADWLWAQKHVHEALDPHLPPSMQRGGALLLDLAMMLPLLPRPSTAAASFAHDLSSTPLIAGAAYVFGGAHLRGGAVIRKRLEPHGLPCAHLRFDQAREANEWLTALRSAPGIEQGARAAFRSILSVMDEIEGRHG